MYRQINNANVTFVQTMYSVVTKTFFETNERLSNSITTNAFIFKKKKGRKSWSIEPEKKHI